jgi:hypothetical protein
VVHPSQSEPAAEPDPTPTRGPGRHRRARHLVLAIVLVALAGALAGFLIGRATEAGQTSSPSWRMLPAAPIAGRIAEGAVWTGKEMIVWGGVTEKAARQVGPCDRCASDGAAYDPATRTWRAIAPSPAGVEGAGGAGVAWTGDEMLVWASNSPDGPVGAAAYDPADDSWRRLPAGPLGRRELYASVWTGKELLVIGGALGDTQATPVAAALDPEAGTWRLLPAFDTFVFFGGPSGVVWSGHEAFLTGNLSLCPEKGATCTEQRAAFVAYDPATDTLREIPLPAPSTDFGSDTAASLRAVGWSGSEVVLTAGGPGSLRVIRYKPTLGNWKGVEPGSCHIVEEPRQGHGCRDWRIGPWAPCYAPKNVAWLGDRLVASCAEDGLQLFDPATGSWTWRSLVPGPSPYNSRESPAVVWTGTDLIVWGGMAAERGMPMPADGTSLRLQG